MRSTTVFQGLLALLPICLTAAGCAEAAPALLDARPYDIVLRVASAPDKPAPQVAVRAAGTDVGTTDASGALALHLKGKEGDRVEVTLTCPPGFDAPAEPVIVTLIRFPEAVAAPLYEARCTPQIRRIVAAVRTERGARLPVTLQGQTLGWTDATGAGLFLIAAKPGERIELGLDTDAAKPLVLHPRNPTLAFVAPLHDDVVLLEQKLTVESPSRKSPSPTSAQVLSAAAMPRPMRL